MKNQPVILVVDDQESNLLVLESMLLPLGYHVEMAKNGLEALKKVAENSPDLILLDILMPKVNGLEMLKTLREDEWGKHVPVIILSNVSDSVRVSEGMNNNVSRYIVKADMKLDDIVWSIKTLLK